MWRSVERSDPVDRQAAAQALADKRFPAAVRNIAADLLPQPAVAMAHMAAYRRLRVLGWLRITFRRWCNRGITGLRAWCGLLGYGWGRLLHNSVGHGRGLQTDHWRAPGLERPLELQLLHATGSVTRVAVKQWVKLVIFRQRRAIAGKQHIVRSATTPRALYSLSSSSSMRLPENSAASV